MSASKWRGWNQRSYPDTMLAAALSYAGRGWDVLPGVGLAAEDERTLCGCGLADCPAPGAHPQYGSLTKATTDGALVHCYWTLRPGAPIVLPTGGDFDVVDVPAAAGARALSRLRSRGLPVGPVATDVDRYYFLVTPADRADFDERVQLLAIPELDVTYRAAGGWIVAPPTRLVAGEVRWALDPDEVAGPVPTGVGLLGTLAYAAMRVVLLPPRRMSPAGDALAADPEPAEPPAVDRPGATPIAAQAAELPPAAAVVPTAVPPTAVPTTVLPAPSALPAVAVVPAAAMLPATSAPAGASVLPAAALPASRPAPDEPAPPHPRPAAARRDAARRDAARRDAETAARRDASVRAGS